MTVKVFVYVRAYNVLKQFLHDIHVRDTGHVIACKVFTTFLIHFNQSEGNWPELSDYSYILTSTGASSSASSFRIRLDTLSGPDALVGSNLGSSFSTPLGLISIMSSIRGYNGPDNLGMLVLSSIVNTDLNSLFNSLALVLQKIWDRFTNMD